MSTLTPDPRFRPGAVAAYLPLGPGHDEYRRAVILDAARRDGFISLLAEGISLPLVVDPARVRLMTAGDTEREAAARLDGTICCFCSAGFASGARSVPAGHGPRGQLFRCADGCGSGDEAHAETAEQDSVTELDFVSQRDRDLIKTAISVKEVGETESDHNLDKVIVDRGAFHPEDLEPATPAEINQACAEVRDEIIREAEAGAAFAHKNVIADIEAFGPPLPELADCIGAGLHHLANVVAGRERFTVSELIRIAIVLGRLPGDWFPAIELGFFPADEQQEVGR